MRKAYRPRRWQIEAIRLETPEDVEEAVQWHNAVVPPMTAQWDAVEGKIRTENAGRGNYLARIPDRVVRDIDGRFHIVAATLFAALFVEGPTHD